MVIDVQVRSLPRPKAVLGRTTQTTRTTKVGLLFQYFTVFYSIFYLFTNTFVLFKWPLDSLKYFHFFGLFSKNIFSDFRRRHNVTVVGRPRLRPHPPSGGGTGRERPRARPFVRRRKVGHRRGESSMYRPIGFVVVFVVFCCFCCFRSIYRPIDWYSSTAF